MLVIKIGGTSGVNFDAVIRDIAAHVTGAAEAFNDAAALRRQIGLLTDIMEKSAAVPWAVDDAPKDYIAKMINGITGLRLSIESIEGVRKLSQNRAEPDRLAVLNGFTHSPDQAARELAAEMQKKA